MARVRDTMGLIKKSGRQIDARYDITVGNAADIWDASRDAWDLICNGFRFGYLQGVKAARAEMRKQSA